MTRRPRRRATYDGPVIVGSGMRLPASATTTLVVFFVDLLLGLLAFWRTQTFRRLAGQSPWRIHPVVWGVVGFFFSFLGLLVAVLACLTTRPRPAGRPSGPHDRFVPAADRPADAGPGRFGTPAGPGALASVAPAAGAGGRGGPPAGWHPDPVDPRRLRLWLGDDWSDEVLEGGVVSKSPLPPFPG
jgi:hypothetical protein